MDPITSPDTSVEPAPKTSRAGRDLAAATTVGVLLGIGIIVSLLTRKEFFLLMATVAVAIGVWELIGALAKGGLSVPMVPSLIGSVSMMIAAYVGGAHALAVTFCLSCVAVAVWRIADGSIGAARDISGGVFVAAYPPLLAGFAALLLAPEDGAQRAFVYVLVTVCSDVGGYAFGVLFGRHPMAPSISPKKSWEGFAGSVTMCTIAASVALVVMFDQPWWAGVILGPLVALAATVGDLMESLIKRDLGIKDMSNVLPGHGGMMDRLDSMVLTAPVVWVMLAILVPLATL